MAKLLFLDNMVWNFLLDRGLDLATELPRERFSLHVTREGEIEMQALGGRPDKAELHAYIEAQRVAAGVVADVYFGLGDSRLPAEKQRVGGFGEGRFISAEEYAIMARLPEVIGTLRGSGLYKNEADLSLAARSLIATVVTREKGGPLGTAYRDGGDVVFLHDFDASGQSLADYITARSRRP